jgi:hypothetical protein
MTAAAIRRRCRPTPAEQDHSVRAPNTGVSGPPGG